MSKRTLSTIKLMALVFTLVLALISILYVLDIFPGDLATRVVVKAMAIMAILTATALITIFLTGTRKTS
ncbi:MAG TPA: hypothetical protein VJJ98_00400 [Sedimentisphaerales bacterium]|nr:hypothetical protein [Sedimentisphaerales bacterium]